MYALQFATSYHNEWCFGTSKGRKRFSTLSQVHLCSCTPYVAVPGWTTASSKGTRTRNCHCSQVPQLVTHHCSISNVPSIPTHSAPLAKKKNFDTANIWSVAAHQPDIAFIHCVILCDICESECTVSRGCTYGGMHIIMGVNSSCGSIDH